MPTTYTHYAYGQEVFHLLPREIQKEIRPYMDYYNIGVHGPDILFYYRAFSKNTVNQYGVQVHNEPMSTFLCHAFSVYHKQKNQKAAFAYLAGFMTHYILDSTCHPYIRRRMKETNISHAEMETDWDYIMMKKDHLDPIRHKTASHIRLNPGYSFIIAPYFKMRPKQIQTGLTHMKFVLHYVFRSPHRTKKNMVSLVNNILFKGKNFQHYFMKGHINPRNKRTCQDLMKLYRESRALCKNMIIELYEALETNDKSFCNKKRFERNFS